MITKMMDVSGRWSYERPGRKITNRHNEMITQLNQRNAETVQRQSFVLSNGRTRCSGSKVIDYDAVILEANGFKRDDSGKVVPL